MLILRPYQNDAVSAVRNSFSQGFMSTLLVLPTGGGKTVVFCSIAGTTAARGKVVWIIVHRIELLRQTSEALKKAGVQHGIVNPKYTPNMMASVQVASIQTLVNRLDKMPPPDLLIFDEAHHTSAGTWKKVKNYHSSARALGVTATPCRGDGTGLGTIAGGVFDDLVMGPQIPDLISAGYLVKPIIFAPKERLDLSAVKIVRGDYDNGQIAELVDKPKITGDAIKHYTRLCPGTPAVVFCVSINHAQHVAEEFRMAGYRAYHADGTMDDDTRTRILQGLGNGTVDVVTSCDLISEGTDIPAVGCAILLRPTQSLGLYLQQVGRALRVIPGKKHAIILDHVGNVITHGLPDDTRQWSLEGEKRKKKKGDAEPSIRVSQCEECYAVHEPAPECPECGYVYPEKEKDSVPEAVDGELVELTEEHRNMLKKQKIRKVAQAQTIEELEEVGREFGHKPGWANHVFNARSAKAAAQNQMVPEP